MPLRGRKNKRVTVIGDVVIDGVIKAKALDLSEGGMFVFTKDLFEKGKVVSVLTKDLFVEGKVVNVSIPFEEKTFILKAVVEHIEEKVGIGLRFFDLDAGQKALINECLDYFQSKPLGSDKKRVLFADPNEEYRKSIKNRLVLEGFDVFEVSDGADFLKVLEEEKVDLVITDISLEKINAFKLLSLMKQTPRYKDIPVLVVSSSNNQDDIERAASAGAIEILSKITTTPHKLCSKVKEILKV